MNGLDEALHYLRLSVNILAALDDQRRIARARLVEANALYERGDTEGARSLWLSIEEVLKAGRDRHSLAMLWLNLGWCDVDNGRPDPARQWLQRAHDLFTKLRSAIDVERARMAFGTLEGRYGDRAVGLRSLRQTREELETLGAAGDAAMAELYVVEVLLLDDSRRNLAAATTACRALIPLFQRAGAKKEAMKALAFLREATTNQQATSDLVRRIRSELRRADRDPSYRFDQKALT